MVNAARNRIRTELDSDSTLLQAIASGDSSALGLLYDRYGRLVYSLAWSVTGDAAAAEEITQDVFLLIWNKASTYQPDLGKVTTWLSTVARNRAIDFLRRRSVRPEGHQTDIEELDLYEIDGPAEVESEVERKLERARIRAALAEIPTEQRVALMLAYLKGYSHQQIADLVGEPLGTVKTRIRLAMQKLKNLLDPEH